VRLAAEASRGRARPSRYHARRGTVTETIAKSVPEVYHVDSSGREVLGTVVATSLRLAFVRRKGFFQALLGMPTIASIEQLESMLAAQGGFSSPIPDIQVRRVVSGSKGYVDGMGPYSIAEIGRGTPTINEAFRFFGEKTARELLDAVGLAPPVGAAVAASPAAAALLELGLPADYGLPAPPEKQPDVAFLRATLAFAWRQVQEQKWSYAVHDASKLLTDDMLSKLAAYGPGLAAAFYVRGLGQEKQGDRAAAASSYREALARDAGYSRAREALLRLEAGGS